VTIPRKERKLMMVGYRRSRDISVSASQDEVYNVSIYLLSCSSHSLTRVGKYIVSLGDESVRPADIQDPNISSASVSTTAMPLDPLTFQGAICLDILKDAWSPVSIRWFFRKQNLICPGSNPQINPNITPIPPLRPSSQRSPRC
jgi:hypothetical protein